MRLPRRRFSKLIALGWLFGMCEYAQSEEIIEKGSAVNKFRLRLEVLPSAKINSNRRRVLSLAAFNLKDGEIFDDVVEMYRKKNGVDPVGRARSDIWKACKRYWMDRDDAEIVSIASCPYPLLMAAWDEKSPTVSAKMMILVGSSPVMVDMLEKWAIEDSDNATRAVPGEVI